MTEREHAIANALYMAIPEEFFRVTGTQPFDATEFLDEVTDALAPRVVAALEAAYRFNPYDRNTAAVLAALRGDTLSGVSEGAK